jgi:hypothetical protein
MPWKEMLTISDQVDRKLFFCSTYVSLGNGHDTPFWEAMWLDGVAPKELAPNLFQVVRFKNRSVAKDLMSNNWIRNLGNISSSVQLEEFTMFFMALASFNLSKERDKIY